MKAVIRGRVYDTDNAKLLRERDYRDCGVYSHTIGLYVTADGEHFFATATAGWNSLAPREGISLPSYPQEANAFLHCEELMGFDEEVE